MKLIGNILVYIGCFFLLTRTIYNLGFVVPPSPGDQNYLEFQISLAALAIFLSAWVVLAFIVAEYKKK